MVNNGEKKVQKTQGEEAVNVHNGFSVLQNQEQQGEVMILQGEMISDQQDEVENKRREGEPSDTYG